jgi:YrbI family 3-deoxy-D-manno-octulosonate 8-phosphate phosphatase
MKKIAIIPLRAGSKGIVNKNKKRLLGRPLFSWVLGEAILSDLDEIFIFTDDQWIIDFVNNEYQCTSKVKTLLRSPESASDNASTEFAMEEIANKINYNFDVIFLIQATSPLTSYEDINKACQLIESNKYDSIVSVVKTHRFIWSKEGKSLNYDYMNRPRRQDFDGLLIENGAIYACKKDVFKKTKNRLGGKIGTLEMAEDSLVEIDEISDLIIVETLLENRLKEQKQKQIIKYFVFDVDGVFTNGNVGYSKNGELFKSFSVIDGIGFELLQENNIIPIVITSENSEIVKRRMEKLKIKNIHLGIKDKYTYLNELLYKLKVGREEIAYMGDDINDLANICASSWGICPLNATPIIKQHADYILHNKGSENAIREAIEFIIDLNKRI